jgi:hypothetical protein
MSANKLPISVRAYLRSYNVRFNTVLPPEPVPAEAGAGITFVMLYCSVSSVAGVILGVFARENYYA